MQVIDVLESVEVSLFAPKFEELPQGALGLDARQEYLAGELNRLADSGQQILKAVLSRAGETLAIDESLHLLGRGQTNNGTQCPRLTTVALRLVEGAKPPTKDPNGNPIKSAFVGKVLVAKVGNVGGDSPTLTTLRGTDAQRRQQLQAERRLYRTVAITQEGNALPLNEAVVVLRAWGVGVAKQIRRSLRDGADTQAQDTWLVEEVVAKRSPAIDVVDAPSNGKRKAS